MRWRSIRFSPRTSSPPAGVAQAGSASGCARAVLRALRAAITRAKRPAVTNMKAL